MPQDGRRRFLKLLTLGALGHTLDLDKLLWVPEAKTFFLPPVKLITTVEIVNAELARITPKLQYLFDRDDQFYELIKGKMPMVSTRQMRIPLKLEE